MKRLLPAFTLAIAAIAADTPANAQQLKCDFPAHVKVLAPDAHLSRTVGPKLYNVDKEGKDSDVVKGIVDKGEVFYLGAENFQVYTDPCQLPQFNFTVTDENLKLLTEELDSSVLPQLNNAPGLMIVVDFNYAADKSNIPVFGPEMLDRFMANMKLKSKDEKLLHDFSLGKDSGDTLKDMYPTVALTQREIGRIERAGGFAVYYKAPQPPQQ